MQVTAATTSAPQAVVEQDVAAQKNSFSIQSPLATAETLVNQALSQNPYVHQLLSGVSYRSVGSTTTVTMQWLQTAAQTHQLDQSIKLVESTLLTPGMSAYAKELAIHDWIVQRVTYDTSLTRYTPYDAFQGSAVCQGIAALAYRMFSFAGIPVRFVQGTADGQSHLWNEVEVGGHWYQLDITWDDPVGGSSTKPSYNYYNLTNAQMAVDHTWNAKGLPDATTDFATVIHNLAPSTKDPSILKLSNNVEVMSEYEPKVQLNNLLAAMQSHISLQQHHFVLQVHATQAEVQSTLTQSALGTLRDYSSLSYSCQTSRLPGYQLLQVDVT